MVFPFGWGLWHIAPAFAQSVQLFLNPLRLPGAVPAIADAPQGGSLTPLRFQIGRAFAADLDRGQITSELRQAFAANRIALGVAAQVTGEGRGIWRVVDAGQHLACRLELDGEQITVHFALAENYADGTLAFRVRDIQPGRYVVSVQIGERPEVTSEMRWGVSRFGVSAPTEALDQGRLPAAVASAFAQHGIALSPNLAVVDFSMPEMNGLQLARQLKAREPALPIFMVTADYDVDSEKKALESGITAVFSKLDDVTTLVANARAVCGLA